VVLAFVFTVLVGFSLAPLIDKQELLHFKDWLPGLLGGLIVFLAGVRDDIRPLPARVKFCFQLLAAAVAIGLGVHIEQISLFGSGCLELGWLSLPITALWLVGITNAFNLVDGLDGLAAGLGVIAAGSSVLTFLFLGNLQAALFLLPLIGALLGFLRYNFHPATIFLGDSGSMFTGFLLAVTAVSGARQGPQTLAIIIPLLILGLPIVDTMLSMVRRLIGSLRLFHADQASLRERFLGARSMFQPDKRHIHHRLLALGFSHRNAVLYLYAMALGLSLLALISVVSQYRNAGVVLIAVGLATYIGIRKLGYDEVAFLRAGTLLRWYEQVKFNRLFFLGFVDMGLISLAYWGAFFLKYETLWTAAYTPWYLNTFPFVLVTQQTVFYVLGLYRGVWRAAELGDLIHVGIAILPAVALSYVIAVLSVPPGGVVNFFCINALALGVLVIGVRSTYQILDYIRRREQTATGTALIYGAGRSGQLVLRELQHNPHLGLRPIGFLDDDASLWGRQVNRVPVLGPGEELKTIVESQAVSTLILALSPSQEYRLSRVLSLCHERGITVMQGCVQLVPVNTYSALPHRSVAPNGTTH
jgi:UDP-GlcNAc:undecaprenyl-phosphate GlcNAc-1-phosphate transferase